jgi:hypothetical protein
MLSVMPIFSSFGTWVVAIDDLSMNSSGIHFLVSGHPANQPFTAGWSVYGPKRL